MHGAFVSIQAIAWVLENSKARLGPRLVLLSIANHADRAGGGSFPSLSTIAIEARMSRRQVIRAITNLEEAGLIEVERRERRSNMYRIVGFPGGDKLSLGGDKSGRKVVTKSHPNLSTNRKPADLRSKLQSDVDWTEIKQTREDRIAEIEALAE